MAKWKRLALTQVPAPGMLMATQAKKHLTIFSRSRTAPGAGRADVKAAFTEAARASGGEPDRGKRNVAVQSAMLARNLATGVTYKRSKSKYGPLAGKFYKLNAGETVGAAIASRGLSAILVSKRG